MKVRLIALAVWLALVLLLGLLNRSEPPQLAVTKAAMPTANAPLLMPPQFCPSPLPICVGKDCPAPRRSAV